MSYTMVSKKELRGMKSEPHANPVEQYCCAVNPAAQWRATWLMTKRQEGGKVEQWLEAQRQSSLF